MNTHRFLTRSTLTLAALSAFLLAQPAHAGLLGGNGSLAGGIGSRPLSVNGMAEGSAISRIRPATLPQRPALQPAETAQNAEGRLTEGVAAGRERGNATAQTAAETAASRAATVNDRATALRDRGESASPSLPTLNGAAAGNAQGAASLGQPAMAPGKVMGMGQAQGGAGGEARGGQPPTLPAAPLTTASSQTGSDAAARPAPAIAPQAGATADPKASASGSRSGSQANGSASAKARAEPGSAAAQADTKAGVSAERRSGN